MKNKSTNKIKFNWKLLLRLLINFIAIFGIYIVLVNFIPQITMWIYLITGCILTIAYYFMNGGFQTVKVTFEMLPDSWSVEEKRFYIDKADINQKKAKKLLLYLLPIILTFLIDLIYLFLFDYFKQFL